MPRTLDDISVRELIEAEELGILDDAAALGRHLDVPELGALAISITEGPRVRELARMLRQFSTALSLGAGKPQSKPPTQTQRTRQVIETLYRVYGDPAGAPGGWRMFIHRVREFLPEISVDTIKRHVRKIREQVGK